MYYLVAYGHSLRCEKAPSPEEAMKLAFGIIDSRRMTLTTLKSLPRNTAKKLLDETQRKLAVRHFHRTGSILSGYEKEPGIANTHHTECELCRIPINTEPKEKGIDEALCLSCSEKYWTLTSEQKAGMSIADMRKALGISIHCSPACVN